MSLPAHRRRLIINALAAGGVLALGGLTAVWLVATKPHPERREAGVHVPSVEVVTIEPRVFEAPIVGYGTVRPKRQVKIIPEVSGQLVQVHEDLAVGNVIRRGELLFEIDPRPHVSQVKQIEAEIARLEVGLKQHEQERESLSQRVELARQRQELTRQALERDRKLLAQGSATELEVDTQLDRHLRQCDEVLGYESRLAMIPLLIQETQELLHIKRAQLDEANLRVSKTRIYCPFDARVDAVLAQNTQVVMAHLQMAVLTDLEALELPVVIDPRELRWTDLAAFADVDGEPVESSPQVRVTWTLFGQELSWTGRITRLERLDEVTRTAHVIVEIRDVALKVATDKGHSHPPLSTGMFCRAELPTEPLEDALVVPWQAIHDRQTVYVFEPEADGSGHGRLVVKRVPTLRRVGEQVLVAYRGGVDSAQADDVDSVCELKPGDRVVVSPLPRAVEGMRLAVGDVMTAAAPQGELAPSPGMAMGQRAVAERSVSAGLSYAVLGGVR